MAFKLETSYASIVLLGKFVPLIIGPIWLFKNQLVDINQLAEVHINVIAPDVGLFDIDRIRFDINKERILVQSINDGIDEEIRDIVLGSLSLIENYTINAVGINKEYHFSATTLEEYHEFGHRLAPKDDWKKFLKNPGLAHMDIIDARDEPKGANRVIVRESEKYERGVYIQVNSHFVNDDKTIDVAIELIKNNWAKCIELAETISHGLVYS